MNTITTLLLLSITFFITTLLPQQCDCFPIKPSPFFTTQTSSSSSRCRSSIITTAAAASNDDISIPIIYENDNLLAICKPPHIPHHDDPISGQLGIMSLIRQQQQQQSSSSSLFSYPNRLYGVHRLDQVTSGILLLAKSSSVANTLIHKFKEKEITKYYMAISSKKPKKKKQGWVKGHMVLGRRGSYKLVNESRKKETVPPLSSSNDEDHVSKKTNNKNYAVTRFFTGGLGNINLSSSLLRDEIDSPPPPSGGDDRQRSLSVVPKTAILFQPHTGKTHQLRVAAKSVGMPILGDVRYGGGRVCVTDNTTADETTTTITTSFVGEFDRTYLHAAAIHFELDNEEVCIYSPPPFGHLFDSPSELDRVFVGMMEKYCDCLPLLHHIRNLTI
jgi:23S rRNA-/tRNA-specific pseudouridylate synthase